MNKKYISIDLISYFVKYLFLIITGFLLVLGIIQIFELISLVTDNLERKLCIYVSIRENNNLVSDFLVTHNYDVLGTKSQNFMDDSTNILGITIFLRIFEILKYLYLSTIVFLIFVLLNKYSRNEIFENNTNKLLLIISILITIIPIILLIKDYIGCIIINNLPINNPQISFNEINIFFLIIGLSIFSFYLANYSKINNKPQTFYLVFKKMFSLFFILIFIYYFISNLGNLINIKKTNDELLIYNKLAQSNHPFLSLLVDNNFEIFGRKWTYIGYFTDLKTPINLYYIFQIIINLLFIFIFVYDLLISFNILKIKSNRFIKKEILVLIVFILMFIFNSVVMNSVIDKYKEYEYYNKNLKYSILNYEYLYYIVPMLFVIILSSNHSNIIKNTDESIK